MADQIEKKDIENSQNSASSQESNANRAAANLFDEIYNNIANKNSAMAQENNSSVSPDCGPPKNSEKASNGEKSDLNILRSDYIHQKETSLIAFSDSGMQKLATGDVLISEGGNHSLYTENGGRVIVKADGTHSIKGDVKSVEQDKSGKTTVTFADGAKVEFDKEGISNVKRDGRTVHVFNIENSIIKPLPGTGKSGGGGGGGGGGSESWGEHGGGSSGGGGKGKSPNILRDHGAGGGSGGGKGGPPPKDIGNAPSHPSIESSYYEKFRK